MRTVDASVITPSTTPLTVLIVDDDPLALRAASRILRREGYRVVGVTSALDALHHLQHHVVDLVLSDYHMPVMTGAELRERVQRRFPALPFVIMSGLALGGLLDENGRSTRRGLFLPKPLDPDALIYRIDELIGDQAQAAGVL